MQDRIDNVVELLDEAKQGSGGIIVELTQLESSMRPIMKILKAYQGAEWDELPKAAQNHATKVLQKAWVYRNQLYDLLNDGLPAAMRLRK